MTRATSNLIQALNVFFQHTKRLKKLKRKRKIRQMQRNDLKQIRKTQSRISKRQSKTNTHSREQQCFPAFLFIKMKGKFVVYLH